MDRQGIPYVIVEPDNIIWNDYELPERTKERQLIKQQWFGRFALRDYWKKEHYEFYTIYSDDCLRD